LPGSFLCLDGEGPSGGGPLGTVSPEENDRERKED